MPKKLIKLKNKDLKDIRLELLQKQKYKCKCCHKKLCIDTPLEARKVHVHHNHTTGRVICVLCSRCNKLEGKLLNAYNRWTPKLENSEADYIKVLHGLLDLFLLKPTKYIHPTFKTPEEKKALAKKRRAKKKKSKT